MKYTLLIAAVFLLGSCTDRGPCTDLSQKIENKSNIDVIITSYYLRYDPKQVDFSKKITLKNNAIIYKAGQSCLPSDLELSFRDLVEGDSIVIDYGDKIKSYSGRTLDADKRNPYRLDSEKKTHDFVYAITPEDYANANQK
jgi:hypothetical protein